MGVLDQFFGSDGLTPHGFCLTWQPGLLWLHAGSDALIFLAYFSIPLSLMRLARGRPDLQPRWIAWLFVAFILACGSTHALSILTLWVPAYRVEGAVKLLTAVLSVITAAMLWPLVPSLIGLPSRLDMARLNSELRARMAEQEAASAALRVNQTRLTLAQEAGQIGSWDWELGASAMYWSAAQYGLYSLPPDDASIDREAWAAFLVPEDRDTVFAALAAAEQTEEYSAEFRITLPDGRIRCLAERGRVVICPINGARRLVGVSVDVTERQRQTERLTARNQALSAQAAAEVHAREMAAEQMRVMFLYSPDALFVVRVDAPSGSSGCGGNVDFVFETFNPATERLTGRPASDFIGRQPEDCLPPEQAATLLATYRRCLVNDGVTTVVLNRVVEGQDREIETAMVPVRDPRTQCVRRLIGVARDITERTALERQLRHMARIEATNRLTAGIAHDFNNLLQALMGGLEMLLLEVEAPSSREYAEVALHAAQRGAELTHRLLAFSRQQSLQPMAVDTGKLLGNVAGLLGRTLGPQVKLRVVAPAAPVVPQADPAQLEAALVNLVVNAADAMPDGGLVEIGAALASPAAGMALQPGQYAVLTVRDTGAGMAPGVLQQCCEPFFTTKGVNGSGLGLSMVQGFARQSGGELRIQSVPQRGTRVEIWLPLATTEATAPPHVLLVDDVADVLMTAGAFLRHAGFRVTRAGSGQQALQLLAGPELYDALVTDYAMPDLNGLGLLRAARELRPGLPALIITGFHPAAVDAGEWGARVLQKPFDRCTLVDAVGELLAGAAALTRPLECIAS